MTEISVIVPIYNSQQYLLDCLNSLANQSFNNYEVILVDDGSKDSSSQLCNDFCSEHDNFHYFKQCNQGVSAARNLGIKVSKGNLIAFCDSDDIVGRTYLSVLYSLISNNNSDLAMCQMVEFYDNEPKWSLGYKKTIHIKDAYNMILDNEKYGGYLWNKLFKGSIIKENDISFDQNFSIKEDELFVIQYLKMCNTISYTTDVLYGYRQNNKSLSKTINNKWMTIIACDEKIYNELCDSNADESIINLQWNNVISDYAFNLKNVFLKKVDSRWGKQIFIGFERNKDKGKFDSRWHGKNKAYLLALETFSTIYKTIHKGSK